MSTDSKVVVTELSVHMIPVSLKGTLSKDASCDCMHGCVCVVCICGWGGGGDSFFVVFLGCDEKDIESGAVV